MASNWAVLEIAADEISLIKVAPGSARTEILARADLPVNEGEDPGHGLVIDLDRLWLQTVSWLALLTDGYAGLAIVGNVERRVALNDEGRPAKPVPAAYPLQGDRPPEGTPRMIPLGQWLVEGLSGVQDTVSAPLAGTLQDQAGCGPLELSAPVDRADAVLRRHGREVPPHGSLLAVLDRATAFGPERRTGRSRASAPFRRVQRWLGGADADQTLVPMGDIEAVVAGEAFALPRLGMAEAPYPSQGHDRLLGPAPANHQQRVALALLTSALCAGGALEAIQGGSPVIIDGIGATNAVYCQLLAALRPDLNLFVSRAREPVALGAVAAVAGVAPPAARLLEVPSRPIAGLPGYAVQWSQLMQAETLP